MSKIVWSKIALYVPADDPAAVWYVSTLDEIGLPYQRIHGLEEECIAGYDVLVLGGIAEASASSQRAIDKWVSEGGRLIVSGSDFGVGGTLGIKIEGRRVPMSHIKPLAPSSLWPGDAPIVRVFHCDPAATATATALAGGPQTPAALTRRELGSGCALYFAPHLGKCFSAIRMGRSVETDGIGPSDVSADLDDGVLRAEDGTMLCFDRDRFKLGNCPTPLFAIPYADVLRDIWLNMILESLDAVGKPYYWPWIWPDNADSVTMWTVDCETDQTAAVDRFSHFAEFTGLQPTFLTSSPGFSSESLRHIRRCRGEIGLSFDIRNEQDIEPERLRLDSLGVLRGSGFDEIALARPADGQWRRWDTLYASLAQSGVRISAAKGGRQPGTSGFLFGGSVPFRPVSRSGQIHNIFEFPYAMHFPEFPKGAVETIVESAKRRFGCFHASLEIGCVAEQAAEDTMRQAAHLAHQLGFKSYRATELAHHFEARQNLRVSVLSSQRDVLNLTCASDAPGFTVLFCGLDEPVFRLDGKPARSAHVSRYGRQFRAVTLDLDAKLPAELEIDGKVRRAA